MAGKFKTDLMVVVREWMASHDFNPDSLKISEDGKEAQCSYESSAAGETYQAFLDVDTEKQWVEMFQYIPNNVPERKRRLVAELLALINPQINLGSLDLLMPDGRVRFRCGVDIEGGALGAKMLDNMDHMASEYLDRYNQAIMAVAFAGDTPERAFADLTGDAQVDTVNPDWVAEADQPPAWGRFTGVECLRRWTADLKEAVAEGGDADAWQLLGHGAIVKHEDLERARDLFRRIAADAGMRIAIVPREAVLDLPLGVADPFRSMAPMLVYLEPGDWMEAIKDEDAASDSARSVVGFRKRLIERMENFDPGHPVVFATSAYELHDVDDSLRAVGAFDRRFAVARLPLEILGAQFIERIGGERCGKSLTDVPGMVGKLVSGRESNRARGLLALAMRRLAHEEKRQVEFIDLVNFQTCGTVESDHDVPDAEPIRRQTAYHEAGHALIAILDSGGRNIPEYSTIVAHNDFKGVVVESYSYLYSQDSQTTYRDFLQKIRIGLAGRAGEHILVGPENVSTGAGGDLEHATEYCWQAFARWGFAPGMEEDAKAGSNLALVYGHPTPSESAHVESLTRQFLADEYRNVLAMLNTHRLLLDAIAERLIRDPVVDQAELLALCAEHKVKLANSAVQ